MRLPLTFAVLLVLAGCATAPTEYRYAGTGQPKVSAAQANATCRMQADGLPVTQQAMSNPFFVAAAQQDFMNHCMAASGWQEK